MSILREDPYLLPQGAEIIARVAATNLIGTSEYSASSDSYNTGAVIQDVPSMPSVGPTRGSQTTTE
jgi:hypothetical protein